MRVGLETTSQWWTLLSSPQQVYQHAGLNAIFHIAVRERPFHNVLGAVGHLLVHIDVPRFGRRESAATPRAATAE